MLSTAGRSPAPPAPPCAPRPSPLLPWPLPPPRRHPLRAARRPICRPAGPGQSPASRPTSPRPSPPRRLRQPQGAWPRGHREAAPGTPGDASRGRAKSRQAGSGRGIRNLGVWGRDARKQPGHRHVASRPIRRRDVISGATFEKGEGGSENIRREAAAAAAATARGEALQSRWVPAAISAWGRSRLCPQHTKGRAREAAAGPPPLNQGNPPPSHPPRS